MRALRNLALAAGLLWVACEEGEAPSVDAGAARAQAAAPSAASNVPPLDATNIVSIASGSRDHSTLVTALKAADYQKVTEVLLATPVFAAPPAMQPLVRQMVTENDRMWTIPRQLMKGPPQPAMPRLESVRVPTLVLIGDKDEFQREPAELLAARIPGARIVRVPGGGHLLNLTSPKEFQAAVSAFLANNP